MQFDRLKNAPLRDITVSDPVWDLYTGLVDKVILPFQWELINDRVPGAEKSWCIRNFRVACGEIAGEHRGAVFQDTDVAKWLEAVAYSLAKKPDPALKANADAAIDLIARAQCPDGYLNTYYSITGKPRWSDLFEGHELYTAGHMIEAAVAYYEATGERRLLDVVCRFADNIADVFGPEAGKCHGYPGHPEAELALVRLYRVTGEKRYLALADYFVRQRGARPCYFLGEEARRTGNYIFPEFKDFELDYCQADRPLAEQTKAEGHAVRAVYLYSAMADLAGEERDEALLAQCETLWDNITQKQMYLTGSIGSAAYGERFTTDYDLPNDTNYSESCASVGLAMFSNRMFQITREAKYMDTVEKALYNTVLAGIALDGRHFFYVNPLEVDPAVAEHNPTMRHVRTERPQWFGVACCPPNIARTLASMGNYIYALGENAVYVNLFIRSKINAALACGPVSLSMDADYPASGEVRIRVEQAGAFALAVRRPGYCRSFVLRVNGQAAEYRMEKGYALCERVWQAGDTVVLTLDVAYRFVYANPRVASDIGRAALMKGPWVYCLEEADNGRHLAAAAVDTGAPVMEEASPAAPGGVPYAVLQGNRLVLPPEDAPLYSAERPRREAAVFRAVPYCLWNNRGKGEMLVWMHVQ